MRTRQIFIDTAEIHSLTITQSRPRSSEDHVTTTLKQQQFPQMIVFRRSPPLQGRNEIIWIKDSVNRSITLWSVSSSRSGVILECFYFFSGNESVRETLTDATLPLETITCVVSINNQCSSSSSDDTLQSESWRGARE